MRQKLLQNVRTLRKNMTDAEKILWYKLRGRQLDYRFNRQFIFDDKYILDFYCAEKKVNIELDGGQHGECQKDKARDQYLVSRGCTVLRFWNTEFMKNVDGCLELIKQKLDGVD